MDVQTSALPHSEVVGMAATIPALEVLLVQATSGPERFTHFDRTVGGKCSCRLLFLEAVPGFTRTPPLRPPYSPFLTASEFFNPIFMREARYDPPHPPSPGHQKGWEVRKTDVDGKLLVIVMAAWVSVAI